MRIFLSVLHLTNGKGGAERTASNLANEMVARGHQVMIHSSTRPDKDSSYPLHSDIRHVKIDFDGGNAIPAIREEVKAFQPDLGFLFYFDGNLYWQLATVHRLGFGVGCQECTNPVRAVMNLTKDPRFGDVHSAFAARESFLAGMHGIRLTMDSYAATVPSVARSAVVTFPNAYGRADRPVDPNPLGRKTIINIGGLKGANKNGIALVRAFALVADQFPDWDVRFFGGTGQMRTIRGIIKRNRLLDRVISHGHTEDIHAEYAKAQIHVICSLQEGNPNAVCEAMSHGIPSIGFDDCAGTNELIRHDVNGLLVGRAKEVESLASALARLMADADLRTRLGSAAHEHALAFDPKHIFDSWEALFNRIASYKDRSSRVFDEQSKIDPVASRRYRAMRNRFTAAAHFSSDHLTVIGERSDPVPLVSFIVPLFNKQDFIEVTLKSIEACSYPNKEIVVVDDCSTDSSLAIAVRFARETANVRVVRHEQNQGLSGARNTGLEAARGTYIQFWDADDIYDANSLRLLVSEMEEDGADIGTGVATRNGSVLSWHRPGAVHRRRTNLDLCPQAFSTNSTCFKLFRKQFLNEAKIRFVQGLYMQDAEFNLRAFPAAARLTVTPYVIGDYRALEDSASKIFSAARIDSAFEIDRLSRRHYRASGLDRFEPFRQAKVMTFVFKFFLKRLLQMQSNDLSPDDVIVLTPEMADPATVEYYVQKFESAATRFGRGIRYLSLTEPATALAYSAVAQKKRAWASSLFAGRLPQPGFEGGLADGPGAFPIQELVSLARRTSRKAAA